jgi:hypothetical protein
LESQATAIIPLDFACSKCGYNLRGLPAHGTCPECGRDLKLELPPGEEMTFHTLSPPAVRRVAWRVTVRVTLPSVIIAAVVMGLVLWRMAFLPPATVFIVAAATAVGLVASAWKSLLNARRQLTGYVLVSTTEGLLRRVPTIPPFQILRAEVKRIEQSLSGTVISTADRLRFIAIPDKLDGYETLVERLRGWAPWKAQSKAFIYATLFGLPLLIIVSVTFFLVVERPMFVVAIGLVLTGVLSFVGWGIARHPQWPLRTRVVGAVLQLVFVALILARVWRALNLI